MMVKAKKVQSGHVCSVPGCTNRDTVAISRAADGVGKIYLCGECIKSLYAVRFGAKETEKGDEK